MAKQMLSNNNLCGATSSGLTRERSFVRTPQPNKRRSLAIQSTANEIADSIQNQQLRSKPAIEIYRPPSNDNEENSKIVTHFLNNFFFQIFALMEQTNLM